MTALSVVIPAHNEAGCIGDTARKIHDELNKNRISHEIIIVNDHSTDTTNRELKKLVKQISNIKPLTNLKKAGFGFAVRSGLAAAQGKYIAIMMADNSDSPTDLIKMYQKIKQGYDCIFGSRFISGATITDYPIHKLILNRLVNNLIRILFMIPYNDTTNAFKLYSRTTIDGLKPFLSHHFNLTVELPLKAIIRGYSYAIIPTSWTNRKTGVSKLKIQEMGSRYFFIILYCYLEKVLSRGDYKKVIKN